MIDSPQPATPVVIPAKDGYDRWAGIYDTEDNPLISFETEEVYRLLGQVHDLAVADIGCGTGRHAVRLAAAGAKVTGLDFSEQMLTVAQQKPGAHMISFVRHDLSLRWPLPNEGFDRVISCLVLDHIADVGAFFRELYRICRHGGCIVLSVMHPAMMLKGVQARFTDPGTGETVYPASVSNQISDYVVAANRTNLIFDYMFEHAVDEGLCERSPRARKYLGWPLLLMMRLRKL